MQLRPWEGAPEIVSFERGVGEGRAGLGFEQAGAVEVSAPRTNALVLLTRYTTTFVALLTVMGVRPLVASTA